MIADWFRRKGARVAVLKPVATGCVKRREGLVSEDAEFLAVCAEARHPLDLICPVRYVEPLAPAIAAERAGERMDWEAVQRSIDLMTPESDVIIVEGVGGLMVPLDPKHTVRDLAQWLRLPTVVVARPSLGTINHTLLTVDALRAAGVTVRGRGREPVPAGGRGRAGRDEPACDRAVGADVGADDRAGRARQAGQASAGDCRGGRHGGLAGAYTAPMSRRPQCLHC